MPFPNNAIMRSQVYRNLVPKYFDVETTGDMTSLVAGVGDYVYVDADGVLYFLLAAPASDIGNWKPLGAGVGGVTTVFSRPGPSIVAQAGDYNTDQITQQEGAANKFYSNTLVDAHLSNSAVTKTLANISITSGNIGTDSGAGKIGNIYASFLYSNRIHLGGSAGGSPGSAWFASNRFTGQNSGGTVLLDYNQADVETFLSNASVTKTLTKATLSQIDADTLSATDFAIGDSVRNIGGSIEFVSGKFNGYNGIAWKEFAMFDSSPTFSTIAATGWYRSTTDGTGFLCDAGSNRRCAIQKVVGHTMCFATNNSAVIKLGHWDNVDILAGTNFTAVQEWSAVNNWYVPVTTNTGSIGKSDKIWSNGFFTNLNVSNLTQTLPTSAPSDGSFSATGQAKLYSNSSYSAVALRIKTGDTTYNTIDLLSTATTFTNLTFTNANAQKIVLWQSSGKYAALGVSEAQFNFILPDATNSFTYYAGGTNSSGTEICRLYGGGQLRLSGAVRQTLQTSPSADNLFNKIGQTELYTNADRTAITAKICTGLNTDTPPTGNAFNTIALSNASSTYKKFFGIESISVVRNAATRTVGSTSTGLGLPISSYETFTVQNNGTSMQVLFSVDIPYVAGITISKVSLAYRTSTLFQLYLGELNAISYSNGGTVGGTATSIAQGGDEPTQTNYMYFQDITIQTPSPTISGAGRWEFALHVPMNAGEDITVYGVYVEYTVA